MSGKSRVLQRAVSEVSGERGIASATAFCWLGLGRYANTTVPLKQTLRLRETCYGASEREKFFFPT